MELLNIIRVFLVGDVMLGRGIDQLLPFHCGPKIYFSQINRTDSRVYIQSAIDKNGPLPKQIDMDYVWGDALQILREKQPDFRLINLENAITTSETPWEGKHIHYRTHPRHVETIHAGHVDCCTLCNNHVLDYQYPGLTETLSTLRETNMKYVGAGENLFEAQKPEIFHIPNKGRVIVFGACHTSANVFEEWAATKDKSGVNLFRFNSSNVPNVVEQFADQVKRVKKRGDIVILSIHWSRNYQWHVSPEDQQFAHAAIDVAGVDVIHGHSSHHVRGIEVYKGKLIIYGCGDIINDYEGAFTAHKDRPFHNTRTLMYFADINANTGDIVQLRMVPSMMKNLRVTRADEDTTRWLHDTIDRLCKELGGGVERIGDELRLLLPSEINTTKEYESNMSVWTHVKKTLYKTYMFFIRKLSHVKS